MATSKRVLFIAGAVTPFVDGPELAPLVRTLSEHLQEANDVEARLIVPCYERIDGRTHQLHEVIRLSGTEISMGEATETLTVKVASLPDLRMQVYFMASEQYFANGTAAGDDEHAARALFFARAALSTIRKLRWAPDVVHAFGWMSSLTPALLKTEFAQDEAFDTAKAVYTPDADAAGPVLSSDFTERMDLSSDGTFQADPITDVGRAFADAVILPPSLAPADGREQFSAEPEERAEQVLHLYEQLLTEVPA